MDVHDAVADRVLQLQRSHPMRVAIDGCSAAGKSTFAASLAAALRRRTTRPVVEVCLDGFKRAVERRTRYPAGNPNSYYHEMYDVEAILAELLLPLGPGGSRHYRTEVMDVSGQISVDSGVRVAADDAVLVADGVFLLKPVLNPYWDVRVYLDVDLADVQARGTDRDQAWMTSREAAAERYRTYYVPGEQLYLAEVRPAERADIVVDTRDLSSPRIVRS